MPIPPHLTRWQTNAVTVAGDHGMGDGAHQLTYPNGLFVDKDQIVYIADSSNDRVVAWKESATTGEVVAGGKGAGNRLDQLWCPTDVIVDRETNSLLICDSGNRRVVRWPRHSHLSGTTSNSEGEIIIDDINCYGLTMDEQGALYVSDAKNDKVRRYDKEGDKKGIVVAGGHGEGADLDQFNGPCYPFVDAESTLYIADNKNHRVMKWMKGATEGIVVASGDRWGRDLTQLHFPYGVWVDECGLVYVADAGNNQVVRWEKGATKGTVIVGGNGDGEKANQLGYPINLCFDRHGHLYVLDYSNHRVQRFSPLVK